MARQRLNEDRIAKAAMELIEKDGLNGFSIRKLGRKLRCEPMSIYHYYPSKEHILDALVDRVISSEFTAPEANLRPKAKIKHYLSCFRSAGLKYPNFFHYFAVHRLNSPTGVGLLDKIITQFGLLGLGPEGAARCFRIIGYYVMGATLDETSGYAKGPSSMNPVSDEAIDRDFPSLAQAVKFFTPEEQDKTFDLGVEMLFQGLERYLDENPENAKSNIAPV